MNEPTESENLPAEQPQPAPVQPVQQVAPVPDPRRRLRELLSIPESQRTDPQWDEIIELEVQLAPGNRIGQEGQGGGGGGKRPQGHSNPSGNKSGGGGGGGGPGGGGPGGGGNFKRHGPRKFQKPKKPPQA